MPRAEADCSMTESSVPGAGFAPLRVRSGLMEAACARMRCRMLCHYGLQLLD
jgi:hypothetical protein